MIPLLLAVLVGGATFLVFQAIGARDGSLTLAAAITAAVLFEGDLEKLNAAALLGYRVLRFTPAMVNDERALTVIRQALGIPVEVAS